MYSTLEWPKPESKGDEVLSKRSTLIGSFHSAKNYISVHFVDALLSGSLTFRVGTPKEIDPLLAKYQTGRLESVPE